MYRPAADTLGFATGGAQALKVSGAGIVFGTGDLVNAQFEMRKVNDGGCVNLAITNQACGVSSSTNETTSVMFFHGQAGTTSLGSAFVEMGRVLVGRESTNENDAATDGFMAFHTTQNNTMGEKVRITSAGNMGVNVTSPSLKFEVDGGSAADIVRFHNDVNSTGFVIGYATSTLAQIDLPSSNALRIRQGGSIPFLLNTNGVMDGDFNDTSDIALKKDIEDLTNTIDGVKALKPSTFKWIDELRGDRTKIGFIAQDIEEHFPELVDGEDGRKSISTIGLVSVLTKTIQDLIKRIEELEK